MRVSSLYAACSRQRILLRMRHTVSCAWCVAYVFKIALGTSLDVLEAQLLHDQGFVLTTLINCDNVDDRSTFLGVSARILPNDATSSHVKQTGTLLTQHDSLVGRCAM
eukprot:TRINITY_DN28128_c0_g1_i1.p1 TRINITY_DN28128_c0_g1~~TRINITY_DN28128_c0_g1_i1.p1  ORF type:complete len:108 (-),score=0.12 TRINITY_DN28128_c0_g1_i1:80-403(-)